MSVGTNGMGFKSFVHLLKFSLQQKFWMVFMCVLKIIIIKENNRQSEKTVFPIRRILSFVTYDIIRLNL